METNSHQMLKTLEDLCKKHLEFGQALKLQPLDVMRKHPSNNGWNALECLEHLNRYGDFYLPEVAFRIGNSQYPPKKQFKSGWLGNYSAESMKVTPKMKKMKTLKAMDPAGSALTTEVVEEFIHQTKVWIELLQKAELVDLQKTKTRISILPLVKFRLGDTLRFVVYHADRHVEQAKRALSS